MSNLHRIMWNGTVRALPLADQLRATSLAACDALSVTPSDYVKWLGTNLSTREMLAMADDAGVRITHLDPFVRWIDEWAPDLPDFPTDAIAFEADDFFRMAAALEVESFTAWAGFPAGRYQTNQLIDAFGELCRRAAVEGLRCDLEFIPVFGIRDLRIAWAIVEGAGAANSGIVLDLWHYMRGGRDDALLRSIPGDRITAVQLCDATTALPAGMSLVEDGLNNRRAPGDGDFPVQEIIQVLRESGGLNNVGLEIFSPQFDAMSAEVIGSVCGRILDEQLGPTLPG
jgi:4-hydroxyphenylpyruvate dioxygenase